MKTPPSTVKRFVAYYRVSTERQGRSGLGLEAQRDAVMRYLAGIPHELVEVTEIESGKRSDRPQLRAALALCKRAKAVLVIAKLDRLARNVHFVSGLIETGVEFVAADMPMATKTMLHIHATMAEWERDQISARIKAALAAWKVRNPGKKLGNPRNLAEYLPLRIAAADAHAERLRPTLEAFLLAGYTQRTMVEQLNALGQLPPSGKAGRSWHLVQLQRVLSRLRKPAVKAAPKRRLRLVA